MRPVVRRIEAKDAHGLRFRVLRAERPSVMVEFALDVAPTTVHFAVVDADDPSAEIVGVSTWGLAPSPVGPDGSAVQLRGMAVEPSMQRHGLGRLLLRAGLAWAAEQAAVAVWANARDTALGFYQREGFNVVGDGFLTADMGLPHHVVVYRLDHEK